MDISELSDIQSESGVIGTLIYHPEYCLHTEHLKANHFYNIENGAIYWAISELYKDGITNIDAYNLSNKLQGNSAISRVLDQYNLPSMQEFVELFKETARHSLEEYKMLANKIVDYSFRRSLNKKLHEMESDCYRDISLEQLSNRVYDSLDDLTREYVAADEVATLGNSIDDIWQEIVGRRTDNGMFGIPSKYESFSKYFTYEPGELVVIQARYKEGKSVLLLNETIHKLKNGVPTLVVDSEMQTRLYVERMISHLSGIELRRVKSGDYSEEEEERIKSTMEWIKEQPFVHIYDPDMTDEKMYSICKMLKFKMNLGFVVFDYLKSNETSTSDNYNVLGAKCDFLKNKIAGDLNIPVLAACQLNRQGEVADSDKINRYLSVGIKWGHKTQKMIAVDGQQCGNAYAKIYVNRLGEMMPEDDEDQYIDFVFSGSTMTILEAKQHDIERPFE